jgi:hypothetical protein
VRFLLRPSAPGCRKGLEGTLQPPFVRSVPVRVARPVVKQCKMWDDTADMPFEQRFIAHRTVPVGPDSPPLELEQAPPTLGGADPLGTACTVWRGGERLVELLQSRRELVARKWVAVLKSNVAALLAHE